MPELQATLAAKTLLLAQAESNLSSAQTALSEASSRVSQIADLSVGKKALEISESMPPPPPEPLKASLKKESHTAEATAVVTPPCQNANLVRGSLAMLQSGLKKPANKLH